MTNVLASIAPATQPFPTQPAHLSNNQDDHEEVSLLFEDAGMRRSFTQVPNVILQRSNLSHSARLTYIHLLHFAWQKESCFPGQERLAHDLNVSVRSVGEYLRELQEYGLIRIQRRGLGKTNIYHICRLPQTQQAPAAPFPAKSGLPANVTAFTASHRSRDAQPGRVSSEHSDTRISPVLSSLESVSPATLDRQNPAPPEQHFSTNLDRQGISDKSIRTPKKTGRKKREDTETEQSRSNAPHAHSLGQQPQDVVDVSAEISETIRRARQELHQWGIINPRIVERLCTTDPDEVLFQAQSLSAAMQEGATITNPAGWLLRAIEGRYRPASSVVAENLTQDNQAPILPITARPIAPSLAVTPPLASLSTLSPVLSLAQPLATATESADAADTHLTANHSLWTRVLAEIAATMPASAYQRWFAHTSLVQQSEASDGQLTLVIGASSDNHRIYLAERVPNRLHMAIRAALGRTAILQFVVCAEGEVSLQ